MDRINAKAWIGFLGVTTATVLAAGQASAQATAQAQAAVAAPAPPPPPAPAVAPAGGLDRDMWIGRLGIGWLGTRLVPIGTVAGALPDPTAPAAGFVTVNTPIIGARYWINQMIGVDGGIGFYSTSGSISATTAGVETSVDKISQMAFLLHGGVPIALGLEGKHYSFQITPEFDLAFASGSAKAPATPDTSLSGFLFQLGARAGAEVFFGFIGVPALSLEGSVGLYLATQTAKSSRGAFTNAAGVAVADSALKDSTLLIATSALNNPWQIFTSNVAARYYF